MIERAVCPTLIGREDELSSLEDALLDVGSDEGRVVILSGEAGLGKTRLATELRRQAAKLGHTVLWGSCSEAELAVPYLPMLEAVGNHLLRVDVPGLSERLGPSAGDLARVFPQFAAERTASSGEDPTQAKLRFFEAVLGLLQVLAQERPLVLIVEDLHWADPSTHELIDYLARRIRASRVLLLVTYRLEEMDRHHPLNPTLQGWRRAGLAETIQLAPLPPGGVADMVSAIFDEPQVGMEFRDYLHRRSEGNPFVLEEMLKEALDSGDIFRSETGWERKAIKELRIPATVRDTILRRLERLDPPLQEVLRTAAVIGSTFDAEVLATLCAVDAGTLDEILRLCVRQQFVESDGGEQDIYRFRHSLTWETIHGDIAAPQRVRLHGRAADVLEERGAPASERAQHLARAGRRAEAIPLWILAAEDAVRCHAFVDAADFYQRALAHIDDPVTRAGTQLAVGEALWSAGSASLRPAVTHLESAVVAFEAAGLSKEVAQCRLLLGRCLQSLGDRPAARQHFELAHRVLEERGPSADLAMAYLRLANVNYFDAEWDAALAQARRAIDTATVVGADTPRLLACLVEALLIAEEGQTEECVELLDQTYVEAAERDLLFIAGNALNNGVWARVDTGRLHECPARVELMRLLPEGVGVWREQVGFIDGQISTRLGLLARARDELLQFLAVSEPEARNWRTAGTLVTWTLLMLEQPDQVPAHAHPPDDSSDWVELIAEVYTWIRYHLAAGTADQAVAAADQLLARYGGFPPGRVHGIPELADQLAALFVELGETGRAMEVATVVRARTLTWSPWGRRALGRVLLCQGEVAEARALLVEAASEFAATGYRIDDIETRLLAAEAAYALGDLRRSIEDLQRAVTQARECDALHLDVIATRRLRELGVVEPPPSLAVPNLEPVNRSLATAAAIVVSATVSREGGDAVRAARLHRWARGRVASHHGEFVDAGDADITSVFLGAADASERCVDALRFAVALRDKAVLLDVPLRIGVSVAHHGPAPIVMRAAAMVAQAEPDHIMLTGDVAMHARHWLDAHRLHLAAHGPSMYVLRRSPVDEPGVSSVEPTTVVPNRFHRDGEYWTLSFRGAVVRLKDSKGVRDLATLLAHPGREVSAVELASSGRPSVAPGGPAAIAGMAVEADLGPVLDDEARREYRARLADLDDDIASAEAANDPERATRAREEREILLAELSAAVGLGGRARRMLDPAERARKTVTWRLRDAIDRIVAADKGIGDHFRRSVRTGTFCVYDPAEPTTWST